MVRLDARPQPLDTARLLLRPLGPEHAPALFESLADPAVYTFIPVDRDRSVVELAARYSRMLAGPGLQDERWWNWAVAERARPERFFGTVEFSIDVANRTAVLGYVFGSGAWGHGFASEACRAGLRYVSERLSDMVVDAFIDTRNARSIALAERLHFRREETLVAAAHFKGRTSDEYRYRLTPREQRHA